MKKKEPHTSSLLDVYGARAKCKRRLTMALVMVVCACLIGAGWWILFRSPFFRVAKTDVRGNEYANADDILMIFHNAILRSSAFTRFMGSGNMLAWQNTLQPSDLASVPRVKNLSIEKNWRTHVITIMVTERIPVGVWCQQALTDAENMQTNADQPTQTNTKEFQRESASSPRQFAFRCWWFDDEGLVFESAPAIEGNLIHAVNDYSASATSSTAHTVGLYQKVLPLESIPNLFSIFNVLDDSGFAIREVRLEDLALEEIKVRTYDGPQLYFSLRFPAQNAAAVLRSLSQSGNITQLQYVDFRVENRAYYQ